MALTKLLAREVDMEDVDAADRLLRDYCIELLGVSNLSIYYSF